MSTPFPFNDPIGYFEAIILGDELNRLRSEFEGMKPPAHDDLSNYGYNPDGDVVEGVYYLPDPLDGSDPTCYKRYDLRQTFADFLGGRLREGIRSALNLLDEDFKPQATKKGYETISRFYVRKIGHLLDEVGQREYLECRDLLHRTLSDLAEAMESRTRMLTEGYGKQGQEGAHRGRPLDGNVPQEEIEQLVRRCASDPKFQHRDGKMAGQPKPTAIRDWLMKEHFGLCGPLSDRALFDRVKRALENWKPEMRG